MDREQDKKEAQYVKDQIDESEPEDMNEVLNMFAEIAWPTKRSQDQ